MYKWDEMTPRERDALVAKSVMNEVVRQNGNDFQIAKTIGTLESWIPVRGYSTDITETWNAVEKLQSRGIYLDIDMFADFSLVTAHQENGHEIVGSTHRRVIDAICITLLRAVSVDIDIE